MTAPTYRTDWHNPTDSDANAISVVHYRSDLKAARAMARKMSRATGSAYVVKTVDGQDVAEAAYTDGAADGGWSA